MTPARMTALPSQPRTARRSPATSTPKRAAKTGSAAKMSAVWPAVVNFWAAVWMKKASAVAARPVKRAAPHTAPGTAGKPPAPSEAPPLRSATVATCTSVRRRASRPGERAPRAVMWPAKPKAQPKTSKSPRCIDQSAFSESSARPAVANAVPASAVRVGRRRQSRATKSGTSTTESPVMNPALEAVVSCRPKVCRA